MRVYAASYGNNDNSGASDLPVRTISAAVTKALPGGEVVFLDTNNYGTATITQSVTIDGSGVNVNVSAFNAATGFIIQAGPNDIVTIRNINFLGVPNGFEGIRFVSGAKLIVENCTFNGFSYGIQSDRTSTGYINVSDCKFTKMSFAAIRTNTTNGNIYLTMNNVNIQFCLFGVLASNGTRLTLSNSILDGNSACLYFGQSGSLSKGVIDNCVITNNSKAFELEANTRARFVKTSFTQNDILHSNTGGVFESDGTNTSSSNITVGSAPVLVPNI